MNTPIRIPEVNGYQFNNLIAEKLPRLQAQTLLFCACGFSEKKSAAVLDCSVSNVRQAKQALFFKLHANTGTELITKAFASAYLRFASFLIAALIGMAAPTVNDDNPLARNGRPRPARQLRTRSGGKPRNGNDIFWSPETNELVWS